MESHIGELAALATAFCWTVAATAFEKAGKRVGSISVNIIRLLLGMAMISAFTLIVRGSPLPLDAPRRAWLWLSLSGLAGFVVGDLLLFKAFTVIGSRISMLIYCGVPLMTALIGRLWLHETLSIADMIGMGITILGICIVVLMRHPERKRLAFAHPTAGILYAFGGSIGQATGLVLSKFGSGTYNAFAASQIRIIAGIVGFTIVITAAGRWKAVGSAIRDGRGMKAIGIGSIFGPFLGVSLSLYSVQRAATGVASTIMALVPVLLIPVAIFYFREKIFLKEIAGAFLAVAGVAVLFLT